MTSVQRRLLPYLLGSVGLLGLSGPLCAVEIVTPQDGVEIPIGSEVVVQVKPSPDDDIVRVYMSGSEEAMRYNDKTGYFEQRVKLRGDAFGSVPVEVTSVNSKNVISTATVNVYVKLPPVLPLISLRIHAEQRKLVLEDIGEKQNLQVIGEFPDGTVRNISANLYGTTYVSRNTDVATVDANGIVTAMSAGETVILVRNGQNETQAKVIVKAKLLDGEKKDT
jgi:Big-like domain-containing protein